MAKYEKALVIARLREKIERIKAEAKKAEDEYDAAVKEWRAAYANGAANAVKTWDATEVSFSEHLEVVTGVRPDPPARPKEMDKNHVKRLEQAQAEIEMMAGATVTFNSESDWWRLVFADDRGVYYR